MITNENSVLTTLGVKYWSGYKHDKMASLQTIQDNNMEAGSGKFNKKLLPKDALKEISNIVQQFKYYFNDNTLIYPALLGTRILPTSEFMEFSKAIGEAQDNLAKAVSAFAKKYKANLAEAKQMLGGLYNPADYPNVDDLHDKFHINVNFLPVPEPGRFSGNVCSTSVNRLTDQLKDMSLDAKYDLVNRTEKVAKTLMDTLINDNKRIFRSTVIVNVDKLSNQLSALNYDNDPLIQELKEAVDDNILNIRMDYLRDSLSYRGKIMSATQKVLDLVDEINDAATNR